jgi:hypothetical protein
MTDLQTTIAKDVMAKAVEDRLPEYFGFKTGNRGTLTSRTIMLEELSFLLGHTEVSAGREERWKAIVDDNILGKKTASTRRLTAQRLSELYALDPSVPLFRSLLSLWATDRIGRPLLALLCASARDPLLRMTAGPILQSSQGQIIKTEQFVESVSKHVGDRFNPTTLHSIARHAAASWAQSGHLTGKSVKLRSKPQVTAANTTYALLLGYLSGARGLFLFSTFWSRLLDASEHTLHELAKDASARGLLNYRSVGNIVEVDFPEYLNSKDREMLNE